MANEPLNQKVETKAEPQVQKPVEQPKVEAPKVDEDEQFINSLLEDVGTEAQSGTITPEQQRLINKNAEEARKRRAAEAAAAQGSQVVETKVEGSTIQQPTPTAQPTEQPKVEAPKPEEKPKEEPKVENQQKVDVNALGKQLVDFKAKYPDIDLATLDGDKAFKKFIDGKLLGKKDFTTLYEEYVELKAEITGKEVKVVQTNYQKAQSSTGKSTGSVDISTEVYSEEELRRIALKLPFMSAKDAAKIEGKLKKSIAFYESKK